MLEDVSGLPALRCCEQDCNIGFQVQRPEHSVFVLREKGFQLLRALTDYDRIYIDTGLQRELALTISWLDLRLSITLELAMVALFWQSTHLQLSPQQLPYWKHSQYFLMHMLFLHWHPRPPFASPPNCFWLPTLLLSCWVWLCRLFSQSLHLQVGLQSSPARKHSQYIFLHLEFLQLHALSSLGFYLMLIGDYLNLKSNPTEYIILPSLIQSLHLLGVLIVNINISISLFNSRTLKHCRYKLIYNWAAQQQSQMQASVQQILSRLKVKSVQELLSSDTFNIDNISKSTSLHKIAVEKLLSDLMRRINQQYPDNGDGIEISLQAIFKNYQQQIQQPEEKEKGGSLRIQSNEMVEILGRACSGKTWLMNQLIIQYIRSGYSVIYLDSHNNASTLRQELIKSNLTSSRIQSHHFTNVSEFSMLIHIIGNRIIAERDKSDGKSGDESGDKSGDKCKYILCIDGISQLNSIQHQLSETQNTLDYKILQKLKRLLIQFSTKACSIIFTNQAKNTFTLFSTQYKNERARPMRSLSNHKIWDSLAAKTICIDYAQSPNSQTTRLYLTKDMHSRVYQYNNVNQ